MEAGVGAVAGGSSLSWRGRIKSRVQEMQQTVGASVPKQRPCFHPHEPALTSETDPHHSPEKGEPSWA